jgi:4-amino-4-deoxy-L-arabinose transferase-like glycosyltransferase
MQRRELVLFLLVLFAGVGLRALALSRSAVEHFDEGVYASNLWFGPPDFAYPLRHLYAPPLLPALIEAGMIAGLPPNLAALLPSFLAGCATIAALWWLGRTWFGPGVGLAAATLCALSDFHIAYSAAALTDVLLGLWIVLAVQSIGLSLWRGDLRWAVAGGFFTGLAWWTKYNGWLPLAILAAAIPLLRLSNFKGRGYRQTLHEQVACFAVVALVAFAIWGPYLLSLEGGYAPIAANHARYVVGVAGWPDGLSRQIASQHVIEGWLSPLGLPAALAVAWIAGLKEWSSTTALFALGAALAAWALAWLGSAFAFVTVAGALGIAVLYGRQWKLADDRQAVGLALVAAWWCGLAFATPCYWPYPRLVLPWLLASWVGTGVLCDRFLSVLGKPGASAANRWLVAAAAPLVLIASAVGGWIARPPSGAITRNSDRRGLLPVVAQMQSELAPAAGSHGASAPRVFYVLGEPAILFQLRAAGEPLVIPVQSAPTAAALDGNQPIATYLILGPHSLGQPEFQGDWHTRHNPPWELLAVFHYEPSNLVQLDLHDPRQPAAVAQDHNSFKLYRLPRGH